MTTLELNEVISMNFERLVDKQPIVPFIRESEYARRTPWYLPERRLLDYLLVYMESGTMVAIVAGNKEVYQAGDFCLIQPNVLHTLEGITPTVTPFMHFDIFYHPRRKESFPTKAGQTNLQPYTDLIQPRLNDLDDFHLPSKFEPKQFLAFRDLFLKTVHIWNLQKSASNLEAQVMMTELVAMLIATGSEGIGLTVNAKRLDWIPAYFQVNLSTDLSLEQMAARANLSPSRFRGLFKSEFGMSPHQYFVQLRIEHATYLLKQTDHTIERIAEYCGFSDIHHFSNAYKKHCGIAPTLVRKKRLAD
jgi:AraC-like DNA-binding protein